MHKTLTRTFVSTFLISAALSGASASFSTIVNDPMEGLLGSDWQTHWVRIGTYIGPPADGMANFTEGVSGLTPTIGTRFWSGWRGPEGDAVQIGTRRAFPGLTFEPGEYLITFDVGMGDDWDAFMAPTVLLVAVHGEAGTYRWADRVDSPEIIDDPTPAPGTWERWTLRYTISESSVNVDGLPVVGAPIGILVLRSPGQNEGYAVDNLTINFTPTEPFETDAELLLAWDSGRGTTFAVQQPGVSGHLSAPVRSTQAGSTDGTFGSAFPGADADTIYSVAMTPERPFMDWTIENETTDQLIIPDALHFDAGRNWDNTMRDIELIYWRGDLDMPPLTVLFRADNLPRLGSHTGDWTDFDVSFRDLPDRILAPGEEATFRLLAYNGTGWLNIDNSGFSGFITNMPPAGEEGFMFTLKSQPSAPAEGELLYNGIRLPVEWPPRTQDPLDDAPMRVPYLEEPPEIIPIDVGRQLFVDDFLVEDTTLTRTYHMPVKYEGNPILFPETPIELNDDRNQATTPKSGGVWWDPEDQVFKMWYEAGWINTVALATSTDGLHWDRPVFPNRRGYAPDSNQVIPDHIRPDSWTVIPDWNATDPDRKFTFFLREPGAQKRGALCMTSSDGINWTNHFWSGPMGDRSSHFFNPFRNRWVFSLRTWVTGPQRSRRYWESEDFMDAHWRQGQPPFWVRADRDDPPDPEIGDMTQLYNLDAVAYESLMLGLFEIHRGPHNDVARDTGIPKITELNLAYSRDGFHWHRPDRRTHIAAEREDVWDRAYVQSVGGVCAIVGDQLYFYYSAYQGDEMKAGETDWLKTGMYERGATGVAMLRRDGFASMDGGSEGGALTTRPVTFNGRHLFVNADVPDGTLRAEVRDMNGQPIAPFTLANSVPYTGNQTLAKLAWTGGDDLSALSGQPVRFLFELENGSLYAFWISRNETGRSDGYVAAGGPGYTGPVDTVGGLPRIYADDDRTWQGIPGIERSSNGRIFVSWFTGGEREPRPENEVLLAYSDDDGLTFSRPIVMAGPKDGSRAFDPSLWIDPLGRLWYFFNRGNPQAQRHDVHARICEHPDAPVLEWSEEFRVGFDESPFAFKLNKQIVLSTGEWIMPVTHALEPSSGWFAGSRQVQGVARSTDQGASWSLHGAVEAPEWALESMVVELQDGRLWKLIRTGDGVLWQSHSEDKGLTWSEGTATDIASPGSRFYISRLQSGNLLLINHYNFSGRSHLTARLSTDDGATWNDGLLLDERTNVSYPDAVQDADGNIWVTYDRRRYSEGEILLARFREEDVVAGDNVSGTVQLRMIANALQEEE